MIGRALAHVAIDGWLRLADEGAGELGIGDQIDTLDGAELARERVARGATIAGVTRTKIDDDDGDRRRCGIGTCGTGAQRQRQRNEWPGD